MKNGSALQTIFLILVITVVLLLLMIDINFISKNENRLQEGHEFIINDSIKKRRI
jgi:hypothetical protein